ncbi:hypothetical protein ABNF65_12930 [Paenibacillus larvae]
MFPKQQAPDIQGVITHDLYSNPAPTIDGVKQVLDTLKPHVQALAPAQMQAIGYLEYLQNREIHGDTKPYTELIKLIKDEAPRVAPPGFFVRVIEALIPRPVHVDGKTFEKMKKESNANR